MAKSHYGRNIQRTRRAVPEPRKKYGRAETREEAVKRLTAERKQREEERLLKAKVASKSNKEFHYGYYSVNSRMEKTVSLTKDELKKALRWIDSEIAKSEKRAMAGMKPADKKRHIIFDENGDPKSEDNLNGSGLSGKDCNKGYLDCADVDSSCAAIDSSCAAIDSSCAAVDSSCAAIDSSCADSDSSCVNGSDGSSVECSEADESSVDEYKTYYAQLLEKRREILEKIARIDKNKK